MRRWRTCGMEDDVWGARVHRQGKGAGHYKYPGILEGICIFTEMMSIF